MVIYIVGAVILVVILFLVLGYFKAPPNKAYVVSGLTKTPKTYIGRAGIRIPFFERLDKIALEAIQIDVKTRSSIPTRDFINVSVDATASVKVSQNPELLKAATQNFLNGDVDSIIAKVNDLLEGNLREIVGTVSLTEMVNDRQAFSQRVQENVVPDLKKLGLEIINFNVQNFSDDNGVIDNLGIDNVEQIRKKAAIAKSDAQREIAIAEAENAKTANDAKVKAAEEIAVRNNDLEIKQASLKQAADTEKARAAAAMEIEAENQMKLKNVAATDAEIAKAEREAELKQKEIELREYELDALVRKQADADKYAAEQKAAAELAVRQKKAEAERFEREQEAEAEKFAALQRAEAEKARADAAKYAALAEAEGIAAVKKAEAEGIRATGIAEAEGIDKKAEAQKKMGEASILEMYLTALPEVVKNAAAPLSAVDNITMYGSDNTTKLVSDVMQTSDQIIKGLSESTGIDLKTILTSYIGAKGAVSNE